MAYNTIRLKGDLSRHYQEKEAQGTITPGMILKLNSDDTVQAHATAGGQWSRMVAIEDALSGPDLVNTKGNTIDDDYVDGNRCFYQHFATGDEFYGLLAAGENAAEGSPLSSNGDGTLQVATGTEVVVGYASDAANNTAGSDPMRVVVRVI